MKVKIQIIGYSGGGKSTLAARLGEITGLPVLHLDSTHYYGDWQERTDEEQNAIVRDFLARNDSRGWIIDGNWGKIAPERFAQTDMTVLLALDRISCYIAAYRRYRRYRFEPRPDLGCCEKFDRSFRHWLLWGGRTRARRKTLYDKLNATSGTKVVLKTRRQTERFVRSFAEQWGK